MRALETATTRHTCSDLPLDGVDDVEQQQVALRQSHRHQLVVVPSPVAPEDVVQCGGHDPRISDLFFAAGKHGSDDGYCVQALHHTLPEVGRCGLPKR